MWTGLRVKRKNALLGRWQPARALHACSGGTLDAPPTVASGTRRPGGSLPPSPQGPGPSQPFLEGNSGPLQIEPLRGAFLFFIKNIFLRLFEVFICYFHSALSQGHQTSFCADCLYERTVYSEKEILFILTIQRALFGNLVLASRPNRFFQT